MKILVCMKPVVEISSAELNDDYTLDRKRSGVAVNPADCSALEQALLIKETYRAEISVVTMGAKSAEEILKQVAALDTDRLVLISDESYPGSDTFVTANILKEAIDFLGPFDLIIMGRRAVDGETGHVGPQVAALLDTPCITNVTEVMIENGKEAVCERLLEGCRLKLSVPLPAVITVCGGSNRLRPASIAGYKRAKNACITHISNEQLLLPEESVGLSGSPTKVVRVSKPQTGARNGQFYYDSQNGAEAIIQAIHLHKTGGLIKKKRKPGEETYYGGKPAGLHGVCVFRKDRESLRAGEELIHHCLKCGCDTVKITVNDENVFDDLHEAVAISKCIKEIKLNTLIFPATVTGRAVGPMVAALNGLGITADCTELHYMEDGGMLQIRPAYGGTMLAEIKTKSLPQLATVRPGVYEFPGVGQNRDIKTVEVSVSTGNVRLMDRWETKNAALEDAKGIIAGGRGCGREGFAVLSSLAAELSFGLGASRSAVDEGYAPYEFQIGQTGVIVRPQIYIAFGISGSVQHLAGMKDSDYLIAVNTDKKAPIFDYADICIVADWKEIAELLMSEVKRI